MAIKINNTTVVDNSLGLNNIASIDATTAAAINAAGVGGNITRAVLSGATPTGNLNTHTDFTQDLTADAAVSFSNIPTNGKWDYYWNGGSDASGYSPIAFVAEGLLGILEDTTAFTYSSKTTITASTQTAAARAVIQSSWPNGGLSLVCNLAMNAAGTILLIYGRGGGGDDYRFNRYDLSTAYDLSTVTYNASKSVGTYIKQNGSEYFSAFNSRGFGIGYQLAYNTSGLGSQSYVWARFATAWEPNTVQYQTQSSSSYGTHAYSFCWRESDGLRFWYQDGSSNTWQMDVSTAYSINTITSRTNLGSLGITYNEGCKISPDGTRAYSRDSQQFKAYNLSTPHELGSIDTSEANTDVCDFTSSTSTSVPGSSGYAMTDFGQVIFQAGDSNWYTVNMASASTASFPQVSSTPHLGSPNTFSKASFSTFDGGTTIYADVTTNIDAG